MLSNVKEKRSVSPYVFVHYYSNHNDLSSGSNTDVVIFSKINRVATKVRTYFEMRTDGQRFFVEIEN